MRKALLSTIFCLVVTSAALWAQQKPQPTLDEFFNSVSITALKISPDGNSVLIGTRRAEWNNDRFRRDIWIYREGSSGPVLLTNSGRDSSFEWSPDGKWIAFQSDRTASSAD